MTHLERPYTGGKFDAIDKYFGLLLVRAALFSCSWTGIAYEYVS